MPGVRQAFFARVVVLPGVRRVARHGFQATTVTVPRTILAPGLPQSLAEGRFEIRRLIGEGGRKRVYLAYDERIERDVALAAIKLEGLDEAARARVRRETRAMGRLGDHAHRDGIRHRGGE